LTEPSAVVHYGDVIRVSTTEFESRAEQLLEQVCVSGESVQIFEGGRAIVRLDKIDDEEAPKRVFGQFKNQVSIVSDIVGPIVDSEDWSTPLSDLA